VVGHSGAIQKNALGNPFVEDVLQHEGSLPELKVKEKVEDAYLIGTGVSKRLFILKRL
jgi:hypothetical protein